MELTDVSHSMTDCLVGNNKRGDKAVGQNVPSKHGGISSACRPFKDFCRQTKTKLHILTSSQISRPSGTGIFGPPPDISHRRATTNCKRARSIFSQPWPTPKDNQSNQELRIVSCGWTPDCGLAENPLPSFASDPNPSITVALISLG